LTNKVCLWSAIQNSLSCREIFIFIQDKISSFTFIIVLSLTGDETLIIIKNIGNLYSTSGVQICS